MEKNTAVAGREDQPSFNAVSEFTATVLSPTTKLYANGRQQIYLEVLIITTLDGEPHNLTASEKASIRLVNFTSEAELSAGWKYSENRNEEYEFYTEPGLVESTASRASTDERPGRYVRNMFVTTTDDIGISRKLALAITRASDGLVIITNANNDSDFHNLDYEVTVQPQRIPSYLTNNYAFEKQLVHGQEGTPVFIYNYYVGLISNSNESIAFRSMKIEDGGMIQWEDKNPQETFASYVGYGEPGDSKARYNPNIVLGNHVKEETVRNPIEGKGPIILAGNVDINFHTDSAIKYPGPCKVTATDANGNDHAFYIAFKEPAPGADDPSAKDRYNLTLYK
jgi:hypothetical protein